MRDVIPAAVFQSVQGRLLRSANLAQEGWEAGSDEEDTLTGDLGARLARNWSRPIRVDGNQWRWRVTYKKFAGRGPGAFEAVVGADGIVQVEVMPFASAVALYKGILFQAKKTPLRTDRRLIAQVHNMEHVTPGCAAVFEYGPRGYPAAAGTMLLQQMDQPTVAERTSSLGDF